MRTKWILKNGPSTQEYDSFPLAYRVMFAITRKASETKTSAEVIKKLSIVSPIKDAHGDPRRYSYEAATQLAQDSGLLDLNGDINKKAFGSKPR
jgi:hypothetical protein